ncbi:MAG: hypothetical protein IT204_12150 [Fimbriimonadaceae bacterium]|nr:hypothetical protein [Fimbriimonadaceae bacterium]
MLLPALAAAELEPFDDQPLAGRQPVVLLHGWNSGPRIWDDLRDSTAQDVLLRQRCRLYRWRYDWSEPLAANGARLGAELLARPELVDRPVVLVGHSMGGLVARAYLESDPAALDRVALLITCGTPHHGSPSSSLDWLGESNRVLGTLPFVGGSKTLQKYLPVLAAAATAGGRQLGWDNLTQTMPASVWQRADRTLRLLNERLASHPARTELLARYRLYAGYLPRVPTLTDRAALAALLKGQPYPLGAAVLARSFVDAGRQPISAWLANDGVVPLESALLLQPGESIAGWQDGRVALRREVIQRRLPAATVPWQVWPEVDHNALATAPPLLAELRRELAASDANGLLLQRGEQLWLVRPTGGEQPMGPGRWLASAVNRLLLAQDEGLVVRQPGGARWLSRGAASHWEVSPAATWALSSRGLLLGCERPAARPLAPPNGAACWSPEGQWLLYPAASGVQRVHLPSLTVTAEPPGQQPLGFLPDGRLLWASGPAQWRGVGGLAVCWLAGGSLTAGLPSAAPSPLALVGPRSGLYLLPAGGDALRLADQDCQPVGDGVTWLAWPTAQGVAVWRGRGIEPLSTGAEGPSQLAAAGPWLLVARGRQVAGFRMPAGTPLSLSPLAAPADGPGLASADGRWLARPWGSQTWLWRTDSLQASVLPGRPVAWLPAPVARIWETAPH